MALISTACQPREAELSGLGQDIDLSSYKVPSDYGAPAAGSDTWGWLQNLISGGVKTSSRSNSGQNIPRGVYTQTGPGGVQTTYVQPEGSATTLPVGTGTFQAQASSGFGLVLVGGAALLVLFMMMRRK